MQNHPHLSVLHKLFLEQTQSFRKVHRMIDLFESIIKTHTVVILSEYVKHNKLSDTAKGLLSQGLRTPSLGTWQLFSRVLFEELQKDNHNWLLNDFPKEFSRLAKALNNEKTNVIAFRNGYAHGATPDDTRCKADIRNFEPFLNQLLNSTWLGQTSLEVRDGKVLLRTSAGELSLHPILLYREENSDASFAFFNDLKNDKVGLLNYPLSKHYREKEFYNEFHEYLPLQEWKKTGNNEFFQRIEELTETFKGRISEREKLLRFVQKKNKGYFSIQGNPGIGKSALIAQFFKDLRNREKMKNVQVVEYFIRRGTAQAQIEYLLNYLIKRTDELFAPGKEIRAEDKNIWSLQQQLFNKWRLWSEHSKGNKLLFLIDGLDEGVENDVVTYMPRENFEGVLIIYGSRPGGHKSIDELWATLPTEHHTQLALNGLSKEDIRALIYEVANKYEVERESNWIDAVQQRSQGNPLYLKLLCDAIENRSIALNDIHALPREIDEYYKAILQRYAANPDGDALLSGLYTFAAAKDYLTLPHLGLINKLGDATLERIGSTLKEVLYENPLTENILDYQLFHESFREYLVKEKNKQIQDAAERIIDFCSTWQAHEGTFEQHYTLEHYARHLSESRKEFRHEELLQLINNDTYTTTQKKVLKQFDACKQLYQLALLTAGERKDSDAQLEAALKLVDLKYEEANDASQVVSLVAGGDIDLALKRIESFGGSDKEGVKRRFILYLLCLMELTLLGSKEKPFRKPAIEKLLNHLDENIPPDTSIINWKHFFPSYTMFLMACGWAELGLDYLMVYMRTENWEGDWIEEKGPYNDKQFEVLIECARGMRRDLISGDDWKSRALAFISGKLAKQGKIEEASSAIKEALELARYGSADTEKSIDLASISGELAKQGKIEEATSTIKEALECARAIRDDLWERDDYWQSRALASISGELAKQGKTEESSSAMQEALEFAWGIPDDYWKSRALASISSELPKQGKIEEALECARAIPDDELKSSALASISGELAKQGKIEEATSALQEALEFAWGIPDDYWKSRALASISGKLAKQGKIKEARECARAIGENFYKSFALASISGELAKQGKIEEASSAMQETLECVQGISDDGWKSSALASISGELAKQRKIEDARKCAQAIGNNYWKAVALAYISGELDKQGKIEEAASAMQELLECVRGITDDDGWKSRELASISGKLAKQGKIEEASSAMQEAFECARGMSHDDWKIRTLASISGELTKQGKIEEAASAMQEALECARAIPDDELKSSALASISGELAKQGKVDEAASAMQEALTCARGISDDYMKSAALRDISGELTKQGKIKESLECARGISDDDWKSRELASISGKLAIQGKVDEAASAMQEALTCARGISDDYWKSSALKDISTELAKQGNWALAETTGLEIPQLAERHGCWKALAENTCEEYGWQKALQQVGQLKRDEARSFYLKGWAEAVNLQEVDTICLQEVLNLLAHDSESIENLLQKHALYEVFFAKASKEKINQLNRSLNIQWALDIATQFPNGDNSARLSTNLDTWLHEIDDEDDWEQIALWARQVAKGKISEGEFGKNVNEL